MELIVQEFLPNNVPFLSCDGLQAFAPGHFQSWRPHYIPLPLLSVPLGALCFTVPYDPFYQGTSVLTCCRVSPKHNSQKAVLLWTWTCIPQGVQSGCFAPHTSLSPEVLCWGTDSSVPHVSWGLGRNPEAWGSLQTWRLQLACCGVRSSAYGLPTGMTIYKPLKQWKSRQR